MLHGKLSQHGTTYMVYVTVNRIKLGLLSFLEKLEKAEEISDEFELDSNRLACWTNGRAEVFHEACFMM